MCHTTQNEQMPLETPGAVQMGDLSQANIPGLSSGPATNAVPGQSGAPGTEAVSVKRPTKFGRFAELATMGGYDPTGGEDTTAPPSGKLTKFGALVHVLRPALEGGMIGLIGGKGHPQGGFGAANDYFQRRRDFDLRRAMMSRQLYNDQFKNLLDYARTQHIIDQPNFTGRGAAPIKGRDAQGNLIYMRPNPQSGVYEPVEGITPEEEAGKPEMTDRGLVVVNPRRATAMPVTMGGASISDETMHTGDTPTFSSLPLGPGAATQAVPFQNASMFGGPATDPAVGTQFDSGKARIPRAPGTASQSPSGIRMNGSRGSIPLRPPSFSTPRPIVRASRNGAGVETDEVYDENPNSPSFGKKMQSLGNSRAPVPDRVAGRDAGKADVSAYVEQFAGEALKRNGNDPDKAIDFMNKLKTGDPEADKMLQQHLPDIRKRILDRTRKAPQKKRRLNLNPADAAAAGLTPSQNSSVMGDEDEQ
jgi:hypothetical protein